MVRDQEVGGSNPLAPTILFSIAYTLGASQKVVGTYQSSSKGGQSVSTFADQERPVGTQSGRQDLSEMQ
jgi:hypothetical protein